jgi:hypothetical protein
MSRIAFIISAMILGCLLPSLGHTQIVAAVPIAPGPWQGLCKFDAIEDTKECHISRGPLSVHLYRGRSPLKAIVIIAHSDGSYPGDTHAIRVDQHKPHRNSDGPSWSNEQALRIIAEMKTGQLVRTRYFAWPYGNALDDTISLDGFGAAFQQLQQAVREP